ncbi:unnamed protein product [Effrenium voratum]|nr:unnamed protein product [Effrenium voratum]
MLRLPWGMWPAKHMVMGAEVSKETRDTGSLTDFRGRRLERSGPETKAPPADRGFPALSLGLRHGPLADVFLCSPGTELGRDVNVQMSSANCWPSVGTASAGGTTTSLRTCQDAGAAKGSGASQEWRAQIHQRALEEMRRYRQALRNCEVGVTVRQCG